MASNLALQIVNTFDNTKVLPSAILPYNKETSGIHIGRIDIDNKMLQIFKLLIPSVMVREKFLDEVGLLLGEGLVVWVAAQDVLE